MELLCPITNSNANLIGSCGIWVIIPSCQPEPLSGACTFSYSTQMLKLFLQIFLSQNECKYSRTLDRFVNKCLEEGGARMLSGWEHSAKRVEIGEAILIDMTLSSSRFGSIARFYSLSLFSREPVSIIFSRYLTGGYQLGYYHNSRVSRMTVWRIHRMLQDSTCNTH